MTSLEVLREKVRQNDEKMIILIGKRMTLIAAIGRKKKALGLPLRDAALELRVMRNAKRIGKRAGLPPGMVARLMNEVMAHSRRRQKNILDGNGKSSMRNR